MAIRDLISQMLLGTAFEVCPEAAAGGVKESASRVVVGPVAVRKRPQAS